LEGDDMGFTQYRAGIDLFQKRASETDPKFQDPGPVPASVEDPDKKAGYSDARWAFLHGKPGPKGEKGDPGVGIKGDKGDKGDPGKDAVLVPGQHLVVP
jgi:hypothetical protein